MAAEDPLFRLQLLQRDLIALSEARLPTLNRLVDQLNASAEDFKKLLERNKKSSASRMTVSPNTQPPADTLTVGGIEYRISPQFRPNVLEIADSLDLDELEAAQLCIDVSPPNQAVTDTTSVFRALLRFHERRFALVDSLRLILQFGVDFAAEDENLENFRDVATSLVQGEKRSATGSSEYWRKCIDGLSDIETYLRRLKERKETLVMTGQGIDSQEWEALHGQRLLLTQQHESLTAAMCYMIRGQFVQPQDYQTFLVKASHSDVDKDISIHYLPLFISGAGQFASDNATGIDAARELHKLFAPGPGQLSFKQQDFKAAATVCWLAEYSSRFLGSVHQPGGGETEESRSRLFLDALHGNALHFLLAAAAYLRPVLWHDPARMAITEFLTDSTGHVPIDAPPASESFSLLAMHELQGFADAFITNMPDVLRRIKADEDDKRRTTLPQDLVKAHQADLALERFIVIMAIAYEGDPDAARDFWSDRDSNLYGFLRWISQRLPTPRVAAFCQLLRSIACDATSANQAHRFLLEDVAMTSGKLRKAYAVSWWQILAELEVYTSSLIRRPAAQQSSSNVDDQPASQDIDEPETGIMLDSYLGLAAHICQKSPDARNWLLKDQSVHLGDIMFQLAKSGALPRIRACCLDLLSALLTDKILEVRNGMWVSLDGWISGGVASASSPHRPAGNKQQYPPKQYLQSVSDSAETSVSLVNLLVALVTPSSNADTLVEGLPFPENLGGAHRHGGIDIYVDFVMDSVLARKLPLLISEGDSLVNLTRYNCLQFAYICLSTFKENFVLLANTTTVAVESVIETKSLLAYTRLHPFARVMEWLFSKGVTKSLLDILQQHAELLNDSPTESPHVQATLKCVQVINMAWKLQSTYVGIVRPVIASQRSHTHDVVSTTYTSFDEVFLSNLEAVVHIASFATSKHVELGLECIALLQRIGASRKLSDNNDTVASGSRNGSRVVGLLSQVAPLLTLDLSRDFAVESWDLESVEAPLKLIRARAVLDLLNASLDATARRPGVAHSLLGFTCYERSVEISHNSPFATSTSLFHAIAECAATLPGAISGTNTSWLLSVKQGCLEIISKLLASNLTDTIVRRELRNLEFQAALSRNQEPASANPLWDGRAAQDPVFIRETSALAFRDFIRVRQAYFEITSNDLRAAAELGAYSVQEKVVSALLGLIKGADGEQLPTTSIFDLFDFFELETSPASEASCVLLADLDLTGCTKTDWDAAAAFDVEMAWELVTLRRKELKDKGIITENLEQQADDEAQATIASLTSWNNWMAIRGARLDALEAWTDTMSLLVTKGAMAQPDIVAVSLQGLLVVMPRLERALSEDLDAAVLLAKLTLTFTHAIGPAACDESQQTANVATERLLSAYRVSLKAITDSTTDLSLRDICYRVNCATLEALQKGSTNGQLSVSTKQILQLTQNTGERLFIVVTEDTFSGRGATRVSALLFLDGLLALFHKTKTTHVLMRALGKLNFIPVLIESSIGNVTSAFTNHDETITTLAFFYTALALQLRLCRSSEGTQLLLNSGLFDAIKASNIFSTDPDIGLDIDNAASLREFYRILAAILRVITAIVLMKGPQLGTNFLQQNRWCMTAVFKRASADKAVEVQDVAAEFSRLITATGFLEDDAPVHNTSLNGFS